MSVSFSHAWFVLPNRYINTDWTIKGSYKNERMLNHDEIESNYLQNSAVEVVNLFKSVCASDSAQ